MSIINNSDTIFATLLNRGRIVAEATLTGVTSVGHVMSRLRQEAPDVMGLSTLNVRNTSQGWTAVQTVYLRAM